MKFWRRFRYYGIGVGMGLIIVFFIFNGRGCSWLPENRVLDDIERGDIFISERVKCELECNEVTKLDVYELFSDRNGDVLFSESKQRSTPKMYMIQSGDERYKLEVIIRDTTAYIDKLHLKNKERCDCKNTSDSTYVAFLIPAQKVIKNLFYTEGKEIKYNEVAKCQMQCFDMTKKDILAFLEDPAYIRAASRPDARPNPTHVFENTLNGKRYRMIFEDAGRRTRLVEIMSPQESCNCD